MNSLVFSGKLGGLEDEIWIHFEGFLGAPLATTLLVGLNLDVLVWYPAGFGQTKELVGNLNA